MKFSLSDFSLIRWSLVSLLAAAMISAIILYGSARYADKNQQLLHAAQRQMTEARKQLTEARNDQENLSAYSAQYDDLERHNVIGDDHRLDWVEGLEKLRRQNLVIDFRYNIAPQKNYTPLPPIDSGNFNIHFSEMKLQFDLLHEEQLLDFFAAMRTQIKGHFQLEGCSLMRYDSSVIGNMQTTHVKAECNGGWVTLNNRNMPR